MNSDRFKQQVSKLLKYMMEKLNIKSPPTKLILKNDRENSEKQWGYTGSYNPEEKTITIFITGRHPIDILRSIAHECIHHWQNENGQLNSESAKDPQYAQKNPHLRKMEKQAFLLGNMIFRDLQDRERHLS